VSAPSEIQSITTEDAGHIRGAIAAGRLTTSESNGQQTQLTLTAAVELAGYLAQANGTMETVRTALGQLVNGCPRFRAAAQILEGRSTEASLLFDGHEVELHRIGKMDSTDVVWNDYLQRFSDALIGKGMDKKFARGLAMSLHEMADNVAEHAMENGDNIPRNVAGWHAFQGGAAFVVLDLGRGIRRSLAENPQWSKLASDRESLRMILRRHATRRIGLAEGNGFKDVVKNFVERNGVLRIRSGTCEVVAEGTLTDSRERYIALPEFAGTRASAWCRPYSKIIGEEP